MDDPTLLSWIERGQNIAALLVAIGVAGEFLLGYMAGPARRRVTEAKDAEILRITKESKELQKEAAGLKKQAEDEAKARASLEHETAQLKASNLRLEQVASPRVLTGKQVGELEALTQFSGRTVDISSYTNDAEGFLLASQILDALSKAHIGIADNRFTMQAGTDVFLGVSVTGGDATLTAKLEAILSENGLTKSEVISRRAFGVSMSTRFGGVSVGPTAAEITVGLKPIK